MQEIFKFNPKEVDGMYGIHCLHNVEFVVHDVK